MNRAGLVSAGDFVRAAAKLQAGTDVSLEIAILLGLVSAPAADVRTGPDGEASLPIGDEVEREGRDLRSGPAAQPGPRRRLPPPPSSQPAGTPIRSSLRPLEARAPVRPLWRVTAEPLPEQTAAHLARPAPDPLLLPRWTTGVVQALVATSDAVGGVDAIQLVDALARGRVPTTIPRREFATLSRGAQILLDVGPSMLPFGHDVSRFGRAAARLLGGGPLQILRFAGLPSWGAGPGSRRTWGPYRAPSPARPVVIVTDLGVGHPPGEAEWAVAEEWVRFAKLVAHAGCPLIALVPYAAGRVPSAIRRRIDIVPWDRGTGVGTVRAVRPRPPQVVV